MAGADYVWLVPADHPVFDGHFPGRPIVPGAMLLDRAIVFAEIFAGCSAGTWQIGAAKFLAPVGPGTELVFSLVPKSGGTLAFTVRAAGRDVASGTLAPPLP